jgi:hypothetical protein
MPDYDDPAVEEAEPSVTVEAEVTFLPTEHGGRHRPVWSDYRGQFYYDGQDCDAHCQFLTVSKVNPGDTVRAIYTMVNPRRHIGKLRPGKLSLIREGNRTVAYGQITRALELEAQARRERHGARPSQGVSQLCSRRLRLRSPCRCPCSRGVQSCFWQGVVKRPQRGMLLETIAEQGRRFAVEGRTSRRIP